MQFIVKILDFLVASNVYVSLGVVSLTLLSLDIRQIEHPNLLWFVFFATLFVYNFIRLVNVHSIISSSESLRHQIIYRFRRFFLVCMYYFSINRFLFFCNNFSIYFFTYYRFRLCVCNLWFAYL